MKKEEDKLDKKTCGIVMPISSIENCSADHWTEVLNILNEVIRDTEFEPKLVSYADDSGIIQKRIIQNLYNNEIVVCDVSAKNPNVMFELGLRLAFDKPTIIIKDDKTDYSFDTSVIEHLTYPRDLRFSKIIKFKELLKSKIISTYEKSQTDSNYTTFLKHFGEYKITQLEHTEISPDKYLLSSIEEIKKSIQELQYNHIDKSEIFQVIDTNTDVYKIVRNQIDIYKKNNQIINDSEIYNNQDAKYKLLSYLEKSNIVRKNCKSLSNLSIIVENALVPF